MIEVKKTTLVTQQFIEVEGLEWSTYIRSTPSNWYVMMGESIEPIFDEDSVVELEKAYQRFLDKKEAGQ